VLATDLPQVVETPAVEVVQPQVVEAPVLATDLPQVVETPAVEVAQPQVVETPVVTTASQQVVETSVVVPGQSAAAIPTASNNGLPLVNPVPNAPLVIPGTVA
jgi:hypothetical protein